MIESRDLSGSQEAAIAAIAFGYCFLFVLLRLDGVARMAGLVLAYLLPVAVVKLAQSLAMTEAALMAHRPEPEPRDQATLGLSAPQRHVGGRPSRMRITTTIAMMMVTLGPSLGFRIFPERPHTSDPAPLLFALWSLAAAAFIGFAIPHRIARLTSRVS